jgi:hypothetical protein
MTMFIRRPHKLPVLCLLVLSLLTSPASSFGYVWCVSADGQATLETALGGDCGMDTATGDSPEPSLAAEDDDCGPCHDVSVAHQWGSPRNRQSETPVSIPAELASVIVATHLSLSERLPINPLAVDPTPRTPEPILHHRTIVLLI